MMLQNVNEVNRERTGIAAASNKLLNSPSSIGLLFGKTRLGEDRFPDRG